MNLQPEGSPGSHWVAVFVSPEKDRSVEYYDSYAGGPSKQFMKDIKGFVEKMSPGTYLKFKENRIKHQSRSSKRCGYHSCLFLMDRHKGIKFKDCSGYSDITSAEKRAKKLEKKFDRLI